MEEILFPWLKLALFKDNNVRKSINMNANEFMVVSLNKTVSKYNVRVDEFTELFDCNSMNINAGFTSRIAFDKIKRTYYCIVPWPLFPLNNMHSINLDTFEHEIIADVSTGQYFLVINDIFHIIDNHDKHFICRIENNKLVTLHDTLSEDNTSSSDDGAAVYIPSKQEIVLIGGYDTSSKAMIPQIWTYKLSTQKWKVVANISFLGHSFGAVLTSNQRYIVLIAGYNDKKSYNDEVNDIYVLDMKDDNWKIKQSKIKCPISATCHVSRTGGMDSKNEILVTGFIKEYFKMKECKHMQLPPVYIISIIAKWFSAEMIHVLKFRQHFGIYLKDILYSLL